MSLMHPAFTTTGKLKGKPKFKSAAAKQETLQLQKEWEELKNRHVTKSSIKPRTNTMQSKYKLSPPPGRSSNRHIPSVSDGVGNGVAKPVMQYTGDKIVGIAQMPKSNAVPIYNPDHIVEIARMRR